MGGFWNPNGGFVVSDKKLSKKEVLQLKQKWSENRQFPWNPFKGWWKKLKVVVLAIFS